MKENITKFSINFAIEVLSYGNMINQICSFKSNTNRDNFEASLNKIIHFIRGNTR